MSINFMKVHQPNMPAPEFIHKSLSKSKFRRFRRRERTRGSAVSSTRSAHSDSTRTPISSGPRTTAPGRTFIPMPVTRRFAAPRARCARAATAFRPSRGARRSSRRQELRDHRRAGLHGDIRFARPASSCPTKIARASRSFSTATICRRCCSAPANRRVTAGSISPRTNLTPGAARVGNYKAVFNLRGDDGAADRRASRRFEPRLEGRRKYVATVPQVFDLWEDPQERYDIFMNNFTERTWVMIHQRCDQKTDADICHVSAAEAAGHVLHRPDHALELREVPVGQRATQEGRRRPSAAQRELTCGRGPGAISGAVSRLPERPDA